MNAKKIRDELRHGNSKDLNQRRKIIFLSVLGLADFSIISLYQTGVLKHLPDIPLPLFDSDSVNASEEAYKIGTPDAAISAVAYAAVTVLASAGGSKKTGRKTLMDIAMSAVVTANALGALFYLQNMIFKQKKVCLYCLGGAAINIASSIIAVPLAVKSISGKD